MPAGSRWAPISTNTLPSHNQILPLDLVDKGAFLRKKDLDRYTTSLSIGKVELLENQAGRNPTTANYGLRFAPYLHGLTRGRR